MTFCIKMKCTCKLTIRFKKKKSIFKNNNIIFSICKIYKYLDCGCFLKYENLQELKANSLLLLVDVTIRVVMISNN